MSPRGSFLGCLGLCVGCDYLPMPQISDSSPFIPISVFFSPLSPRGSHVPGMVAHAQPCIVQPIIIALSPMPDGMGGQHHLTGAPAPPPPRMVNGCMHCRVGTLEAIAKAGHQTLTSPCPPHGKTLFDGHRIGEANGMGCVAFSLMWYGDTQTPSCRQKFTSNPPHEVESYLPGIGRDLVCAKAHSLEWWPAVPVGPNATIGHADNMDLGIQRGRGIGLGPRLGAGLRPKWGPT